MKLHLLKLFSVKKLLPVPREAYAQCREEWLCGDPPPPFRLVQSVGHHHPPAHVRYLPNALMTLPSSWKMSSPYSQMVGLPTSTGLGHPNYPQIQLAFTNFKELIPVRNGAHTRTHSFISLQKSCEFQSLDSDSCYRGPNQTH